MIDLGEAMLMSLKEFQTFIRLKLRHEAIIEHCIHLMFQTRQGITSWILFFDLLRLYGVNLLAGQPHIHESAPRCEQATLLRAGYSNQRQKESAGGVHKGSAFLHDLLLWWDELCDCCLVLLEEALLLLGDVDITATSFKRKYKWF